MSSPASPSTTPWSRISSRSRGPEVSGLSTALVAVVAASKTSLSLVSFFISASNWFSIQVHHTGNVSSTRASRRICTTAQATALLDDLLVGAHGVNVPLPCVLEGVNLGAGLGAVFFGEEDVVVLAGVEGRIEVDEIDGLVFNVAPEDIEVVAVVELAFFGAHGLGMSVAQRETARRTGEPWGSRVRRARDAQGKRAGRGGVSARLRRVLCFSKMGGQGEDRDQGTGIRGQGSGNRDQGSGIGDQLSVISY